MEALQGEKMALAGEVAQREANLEDSCDQALPESRVAETTRPELANATLRPEAIATLENDKERILNATMPSAGRRRQKQMRRGSPTAWPMPASATGKSRETLKVSFGWLWREFCGDSIQTTFAPAVLQQQASEWCSHLQTRVEL